MPPHPSLRPATAGDAPFLQRMLLAAVDWDPARPAHSLAAIRRVPALWHYVEGWLREGDFGVVAVDASDAPVGAAWARTYTEDEPGYGFVRESIPEISMGVASADRGEGLGGRLLDALIDQARERGIDGLSLSVEDRNDRARRLYRSRRFAVVSREGDSDVMLLTLDHD